MHEVYKEYEKVGHDKYLKKHKSVDKNCLSFIIGEITFEFVYYYDKNDDNLLNIVFNGHNQDVPDSKNIYDFEFYECEVEERNFIIETDTEFEGIEYLKTKSKIREKQQNEIFSGEAEKILTTNGRIMRHKSCQKLITIKDYKPLNGKLDHITLHPISSRNDSNKKLQKIHLHLTKLDELEVDKPKVKKEINSIERDNSNEDPILWFFLEKSILNSSKLSDNKNEMIGIVLGRNLDYIKTSLKLSNRLKKSNNKESKDLAEEVIELSKIDLGIKTEDNFIFFIKKAGISVFDDINTFNPKYIYDLKEYSRTRNKKGFVIIGDPKFCCANNQSIFVGFIN